MRKSLGRLLLKFKIQNPYYFFLLYVCSGIPRLKCSQIESLSILKRGSYLMKLKTGEKQSVFKNRSVEPSDLIHQTVLSVQNSLDRPFIRYHLLKIEWLMEFQQWKSNMRILRGSFLAFIFLNKFFHSRRREFVDSIVNILFWWSQINPSYLEIVNLIGHVIRKKFEKKFKVQNRYYFVLLYVCRGIPRLKCS